MAVSTRIIRRRIKSVGNTKKITKAMEMVSASKMRRAVNAVLATRPYATLGWETVSGVAKATETDSHPLLRRPEKIERVLIVFVTSDRGLCGGFNAQMAKKIYDFLRHPRLDRGSMDSRSPMPLEDKFRGDDKMGIDFLTIGKKGADLARRLGWNIVAAFNNLSNNPTIIDVRPVAQLAINDFISAKYNMVYLAYTDFVSSIRQIPNVRQLLPIMKDDKMLGEIGSVGAGEQSIAPLKVRGDGGVMNYEYLFEPSPQEVLDQMLPRLVETQIYQAILESSASEHSARMVAMKNASDAARDMIDDLTFTFNQARQATITREIAEISAGKAAIE